MLSDSDLSRLLPWIPLQGLALQQAIGLAIGEADRLAGRPLKRTQFTEEWAVPPLRKLFLIRWPIEMDSIEFEAIDGGPLPDDALTIASSGEVTINDRSLRQFRIRYWSNPFDHEEVKSAIASILLYQMIL